MILALLVILGMASSLFNGFALDFIQASNQQSEFIKGFLIALLVVDLFLAGVWSIGLRRPKIAGVLMFFVAGFGLFALQSYSGTPIDSPISQLNILRILLGVATLSACLACVGFFLPQFKLKNGNQ